MDDKMLMGVMDRGADLAEELEPRRNAKVMAIAILVDPKAFDVLHDEKRNTIRGNSTAIEVGNVWIIQAREDMFFVAKSRHDVVCAHRGTDKFQCNPSAKLDVFCEVTVAHPACADS